VGVVAVRRVVEDLEVPATGIQGHHPIRLAGGRNVRLPTDHEVEVVPVPVPQDLPLVLQDALGREAVDHPGAADDSHRAVFRHVLAQVHVGVPTPAL